MKEAAMTPFGCVAVALTILSACGSDGDASAAPGRGGVAVQPTSGSFWQAFVAAHEMRPYQSADTPLVRISGVDVLLSTEIVIGDASEGQVKRFDIATGRLLATLGRKGEGPGEFGQPRFPRYGPDGFIHVGDGQHGRITVMTPDGVVVRTLALHNFVIVMGLEVLDSGHYLVLSGLVNSDKMLHVVDSAGLVRESYLAIRDVGPSNGTESQYYRNLANAFLAYHDGIAYVTHALSDTLWTVDLGRHEEHRLLLQVPGYDPPVPPKSQLSDVLALTTWAKSFHATMFPVVSDSLLVVPFVKGVLNYGDPQLLVVRTASGEWNVYPDAPPVVTVAGANLWAIVNPTENEARLGSFRLRP
jgi:hypothetical protein